MRKHLNTLFVTTQGAYLAKEGESVIVKADNEIRLRVPIHTIAGIVCFGQVSCSPFLMGFCGERNVTISFLSEHGRFLARVEGPTTGNVLLRQEQYRRSDDKRTSAGLAAAIVSGKLLNARTVLRRAARDHADKLDVHRLEQAVRRLGRQLRSLADVNEVEGIRGIEGDSSRSYFNAFDDLITSQKDAFFFRGRSRRPPMDNVNCLLSFVYTLTLHDIRSAIETVGLDPQVGFLHRPRPGRPSLALDMMEEFRPCLADRLVLSLVNLKQIRKRDLRHTETGGVTLTDEGRKTVLIAYQKRKQDEVLHPFLREKMAIGLLFHTQALLLARHLRGDLDGYPPFLWK